MSPVREADLSRADALVLEPGTGSFTSLLVDAPAGFGYASLFTAPGTIIKLKLLPGAYDAWLPAAFALAP